MAARVTAVILAGGRATRMGPLCGDMPKCLLPLGGAPFLQWVLAWLARQEIPAVVAVRHHAHAIEAQLADAISRDADVRLVMDPEEEGTAAAVIHAAGPVDATSLLLLNGDTIFTCAIPDLLRFHDRHATGATQVLTRHSQQNEGAILVSSAGRVLASDEGGAARTGGDPAATSRWSSTGWYLFDRDLLLRQRGAGHLSLERDLVPRLIEDGVLYGYGAPGPMYDFGTPGRYAAVADDRELLLATYGPP